jgi:hypothetical protein
MLVYVDDITYDRNAISVDQYITGFATSAAARVQMESPKRSPPSAQGARPVDVSTFMLKYKYTYTYTETET